MDWAMFPSDEALLFCDLGVLLRLHVKSSEFILSVLSRSTVLWAIFFLARFLYDLSSFWCPLGFGRFGFASRLSCLCVCFAPGSYLSTSGLLDLWLSFSFWWLDRPKPYCVSLVWKSGRSVSSCLEIWTHDLFPGHITCAGNPISYLYLSFHLYCQE